MGSFNVACSVSNLSLNCGDPAVYIPLEVNQHPYGIGDGNHTLIYPHCYYNPVTLPLFGEYDDYGRLDLEEDNNLKLVLDFFKIKDKSNIFDYKIKEFTSGMFVHRQIFDALSVPYYEDWSGNKIKGISWYNDDKYDRRHSFEAQIKKLKEAILNEERSKETWVDFNWEDLSEDEKKRYGNKNPSKESDNFFERYSYWERAAIGGKTHFSFDDFNTFNALYQPQILEGNFKEELTTFIKFKRGMYASNNFFFPAMNGCQFGNPFISRKLYKTALDIVRAEIKRQKENL